MSGGEPDADSDLSDVLGQGSPDTGRGRGIPPHLRRWAMLCSLSGIEPWQIFWPTGEMGVTFTPVFERPWWAEVRKG